MGLIGGLGKVAGGGLIGHTLGGAVMGPGGAALGGLGGAYLGGKSADWDQNYWDRGGEYKGIDRSNFDTPGFNTQFNQYGDIAAAQRNAPQVAGNGQQAAYARAGMSPARQQQSAVGRMLMREARGNGPAQRMAQLNAQQMADRGMKQQMAMAASGRPGGALAGRNATMNSADIQSRAGEQAMMGGLAAQMGAQQMAGQHFQGMRGQDQGLSTFNAGQRNAMNQFNAAQGNDMSRFNVDARLRQMNLDDQRQLEALRQRMQLANMQQQGGFNYEANRTNRYATAMGTPTGFERGLGAAMNVGQMAMTAAKKGASGGAVG